MIIEVGEDSLIERKTNALKKENSFLTRKLLDSLFMEWLRASRDANDAVRWLSSKKERR